jgi:hypothetical protein
LPRALARAGIASRNKFTLYEHFASRNPQVLKCTRENGRVYGKCRSGGSFLSIDPVTADANSGSSFKRYAYGNNIPCTYIDPDGRNALVLSGGGVLIGGLF